MMLKWNVLYRDFNKKEITQFNVFQHGRFYEDVLELKNKNLSYEAFSEKLKRIIMYYFWSKCEYEVVVTSWPPYISEDELNRLYHEEEAYRYTPNLEIGNKIDIAYQLQINWEHFVNYVYNTEAGGKINE